MYEKIKNVLLNAEKIAILNHKNPDGDAMGSAYALKLALKSIGKEAEVFLRDTDYSSIEYTYVLGTEKSGLQISDCDLKISVDSSDIDRISDFKEYFNKNTVSIDHHITHKNFAEYTLVNPDAPATGEVIYDLLKYMDIEITKDIAHNLYVAISSDTGSFKYSSTTPKTHTVVSELLKTGIDIGEISRMLFDTNTFEYLKMLQLAIGKITLEEDGKVSVLCLLDSDFKSCGLDEKDAGGIVSLPGKIKGTEISVYIRPRDDEFKVSLRSKKYFDVSKVALSFGGGGHIRAAGCSVKADTMEDTKNIVLNAISHELKNYDIQSEI